MKNLTVFIGPKVITPDQIDDIEELDFDRLPVREIFPFILDEEPDLLIPVVTSDDLSDLITYEEMSVPLFPVILGDAIIHHVAPAVFVDDIEDFKDLQPVSVTQLPKDCSIFPKLFN